MFPTLENPFTPKSQIPQRRLFGEEAVSKRKLSIKSQEQITKTKKELEKIKYGEHEIMANQAQFLFDAEKILITNYQEKGEVLTENEARDKIFYQVMSGVKIPRIEVDDSGNIINLDLLDLKLGKLPESIRNLIYLESLNCVRNDLINLPPRFGKLRNLKNLNCMDNNFTELPQEVLSLTNLLALDLSGNKLQELPAEINKMQKLQILTVGYNPLKEISPEVGELLNLELLSLTQCHLNKLPKEIGQLKNLKILFADHNNFSAGEKEKIKEMMPENCRIDF